MKKVIAAINMTLDGVCDHRAGIVDEEIHQHYTELLNQAGAILYGRKTYELMEFWRPFLATPSNEKSMNDFAVAINKIPKIVFSNTRTKVDWETATLADNDLKETVLKQREQPGNNLLIGSRSLIIQLMKLNLIDQYQLCVYPVVAGSGMQLFEQANDRTILDLVNTKTFKGGAIILYYQPKK